MHALYLLSVWLHIVAVVAWVGGMIFVVVVLAPLIRRPELSGTSPLLFRWSGMRLRGLGWSCILLLIVTGTFNLVYRGVAWTELSNGEFWRSSFGFILGIKLVLVGVILLTSAIHDFITGPRATALWELDAASADALRLRKRATQIGRLNLLLALIATFLGVVLVRGMP